MKITIVDTVEQSPEMMITLEALTRGPIWLGDAWKDGEGYAEAYIENGLATKIDADTYYKTPAARISRVRLEITSRGMAVASRLGMTLERDREEARYAIIAANDFLGLT